MRRLNLKPDIYHASIELFCSAENMIDMDKCNRMDIF